MNDFDFSGKTVLVTGGSMGIGETFARELDRRGAKLVLVARSASKLEALCSQLKSAQFIAADLTAPHAAQALFDETKRRGIEVDVLVNNAGFGVHGAFEAISGPTQREMVDLNVGVLVELTHLFMPGIEQRKGGVLLVGSVAGYAPIPWMATYGGTKAFVLSFGEALWAEYRTRGVRVFTLSPGATDTAFFARSGEAAAAGNEKAKPEDVVNFGLAGFSSNTRPSGVPGAKNKVLTSLGRFFTRGFTVKVAASMTAPKQQQLPLPSGEGRGEAR